MSTGPESDFLEVGKITGAFGIQGWLKIWSYTDPIENLLDYSPWRVKVGGVWREMKVLDGRVQGRGLVAQLEGVTDRNQAELLMQAPIEVSRAVFKEDPEDGFYWTDLEGFEVVNEQGVVLGKLDHLFETAAHHVAVVKGEGEDKLLPWVPEKIVKSVDMIAAKVVVDWQADW